MTHSINFGLADLDRANARFEAQFDKAKLSGNATDIALARQYKANISALSDTLVSKIRDREILAFRAFCLYPRASFKSFTKLTPYQENSLNMTQTYIHGEY